MMPKLKEICLYVCPLMASTTPQLSRCKWSSIKFSYLKKKKRKKKCMLDVMHEL